VINQTPAIPESPGDPPLRCFGLGQSVDAVDDILAQADLKWPHDCCHKGIGIFHFSRLLARVTGLAVRCDGGFGPVNACGIPICLQNTRIGHREHKVQKPKPPLAGLCEHQEVYP